MSRRIHKLRKFLNVPEPYPVLHHRDIIRRVDARLDDLPSERKRYMRQKARYAAVFIAALVGLSGAAFAVLSNLNALTVFFKGNPAIVEELLDTHPRTVSDENYTLTVESSASDGQEVYLILRVDALNEESLQTLMDDRFVNMDTLSLYLVENTRAPIPNDPGVDEASGAAIAPTLIHGMIELEEARTDTSRTWAVDISLTEEDPDITLYPLLRIRLGYMNRENIVQIPLTQAQTLTLEIGATGQGRPFYDDPEGSPVTVERITLSPLTCRIEYTTAQDTPEAAPNVFFLMTDGTLFTQSQMLRAGAWRSDVPPGQVIRYGVSRYRFHQIQELSQIKALVVFGRAYPLDGSAPYELKVDSALDSFVIPRMSPLEGDRGYTLAVVKLCQGLGASYTWNDDNQTATMVYRGVCLVLTPGSKTAFVNGRQVDLIQAPAFQDGQLVATHNIFTEHWGIDAFVARTPREAQTRAFAFLDWVIIP